MKFLKIAALVAGGVMWFAATAAPASATTYDWTLTQTPPPIPEFSEFTYIGSGTLTVNANDVITAVTGTLTDTATGVTMSAGLGVGGDDKLFPTGGFGTGGLLDLSGLSIEFGNSADVNITFDQTISGFNYYFENNENAGVGSFTATEVTPLPSTWVLMIAGLVGLGFLATRWTKQSNGFAAA
jgi:hypothetical protein